MSKHTECSFLLWRSWRSRTAILNISEDLKVFLDCLLLLLKLTPTFKVSVASHTKKQKINLYSTELSFSEVMWLNKRKESGRNETLGIVLSFWDLNIHICKMRMVMATMFPSGKGGGKFTPSAGHLLTAMIN